MEQLFKAMVVVFEQLEDVIKQLPDGVYTKPSKLLSGATIGKHMRHIIELYEALFNGFETTCVNYDHRKRNPEIEANPFMVGLRFKAMKLFVANIPNIALTLIAMPGESNESVYISTTFNRELLYNIEHTLHHMALIRIAVNEFTNIKLPDTFGVAPSTIKHTKHTQR